MQLQAECSGRGESTRGNGLGTLHTKQLASEQTLSMIGESRVMRLFCENDFEKRNLVSLCFVVKFLRNLQNNLGCHYINT